MRRNRTRTRRTRPPRRARGGSGFHTPARHNPKGLSFRRMKQQLLEGEKSLTTRRVNEAEATVGVPFIQHVDGHPVEVTYLGEFSFEETKDKFGGESGYLREEGMIGPNEHFTGSFQFSDKWARGWAAGKRKAHLYGLQLLTRNKTDPPLDREYAPKTAAETLAFLELRLQKLAALAGDKTPTPETASAAEKAAALRVVVEAWREVARKAQAAQGGGRGSTPTAEAAVPRGIRQAHPRIQFDANDTLLIQQGQKRLLATHHNYRIGPGTQVYQDVGGTPFFFQNLGEFSFLGAMQELGGLAGWMKGEGYGGGNLVFPSGATGADPGSLPSKEDLDWLAQHPLITQGKNEFWLDDWIYGKQGDYREVYLYAISPTPFQPRRVLEPCPPDPDLYILPITPVMLKRYISAALTWLSEQAAVRREVEAAGSAAAAVKAVQLFEFSGGTRLALDRDQATRLVGLSVHKLTGSWEEMKGEAPPTRLGARLRGADKAATSPPTFGLYGKYLGDIGTVGSFLAVFGQEKAKRSKTAAPSDTSGASSLTDLAASFDASLKSAGPLPTFFQAPRKKNGIPVILVVTGRISSREGMSLTPIEPGRNPTTDLVPIVEAMVANKAARRGKRSAQVCFIMPSRVVIGKDKKEREIVGSAGYLRQVLGDVQARGGLDNRNTSILSARGFSRVAERLAAHGNLSSADKTRLRDLVRLREYDELWLEETLKEIRDAEAEGREPRWKKPRGFAPPKPRPGSVLTAKRKSRNPYSKDPKWLRDPKGQAWYFADQYPDGSPPEEYFGELPMVQAWPGLYLNLLKTMMVPVAGGGFGLSRSAAEATIKSAGLGLGAFRRIAESADLDSQEKEFREPLYKASEYLDAKPAETRVFISDLEFSEEAELRFGMDLNTGEYAPLVGKITDRDEDYPQGQIRHFGSQALYRKYLDRWEIHPDEAYLPPAEQAARAKERKEMLPPVKATAYLINKDDAEDFITEKHKYKEHRDDEKVVTKADIARLLKGQNAVPLGRGWFLVIGAVEVFTQREDVLNGAPVVVAGSYHSPFFGKRANVTGIVARLLRTKVVTGGADRRPFLSFILPTQKDLEWQLRPVSIIKTVVDPNDPAKRVPAPVEHRAETVHWDTMRAPYLLRHVAVWSAGGHVPVGYRNQDKYRKGVAAAFRFRPASRDVKEGRLSTWEGRESAGKRTRRGKRQEEGKVATKGEFSAQGFYSTIGDTLKATNTKLMESADDKMGLLYAALASNWRRIESSVLLALNADRPEEARLLSLPPPVPGLNPDPDYLDDTDLRTIEVAALAALEELIDDEGAGVLLQRELYLPADTLPGGRDAFGEYYAPDIQEEIKAVENPGRRRPRRPRRSRGRSRSNPIHDAAVRKIIINWAKFRIPPEEEEKRLLKAYYDEARSKTSLDGVNEELVQAIALMFPRRSGHRPKAAPSHRELSSVTAFSHLDKASPIRRFESPRALREEDDAARGAVMGGVLAGDDLEYLATHAELSAVEAGKIAKLRQKSKTSGRILSPSGAVCRGLRNVPKLKYRPTAQVAKARTAWIMIGPPVPTTDGPGRTRIMTFRQGTHIDCDVNVGENEAFSVALGRAIQSMILWLAEKPGRMSAKRLKFVAIGQVGGLVARFLWRPGQPLDVRAMLKKAYTGPTMAMHPTHAATSRERYESAEKAQELRRDRSLGPWAGWSDGQEDESDPSLYRDAPGGAAPPTEESAFSEYIPGKTVGSPIDVTVSGAEQPEGGAGEAPGGSADDDEADLLAAMRQIYRES